MVIYYILKFYYSMLVLYFRKAPWAVLKEEYGQHHSFLVKYFPDYKKAKINLTSPNTEIFPIHLCIWGSLWLERLGLFQLFLWVINKF